MKLALLRSRRLRTTVLRPRRLRTRARRASAMAGGSMLVMCAALIWPAVVTSAAAQDESSGTDAVDGAALFGAQCSSCHGPTGAGVEGRGPDIRNEGEAAADFVLRTGRMPLADPTQPPTEGPVRFSDAEIRALVAHVGAFGDGPAIPVVEPERGDLVAGGDLFRLNCAACHVASGAGAVIGGGRRAPSLSESTPTEIGEAIVVGPGAMPVFGSLNSDQVDDVAAYLVDLQRRGTTDADDLGGIGPVAEGLAAWLLPVAILVALTRWIGKPRKLSDPAQPDTGTNL